MARLWRTGEPVELLFYSIGSKKDVLLLVALLRLEAAFPDHASARTTFPDKLPANLIVPGNPCRFGTLIELSTGRTSGKPLYECSCDRYTQRAATPYLRLTTEAGPPRITNPVSLSLKELAALSPLSIGSRWPKGVDPGLFQKAVQNGAHWIRVASEIEAIRKHFLKAPDVQLTDAATSSHLMSLQKALNGLGCEAAKRPRDRNATRRCR